jgi:hypothetical protein
VGGFVRTYRRAERPVGPSPAHVVGDRGLQRV